MNMAARRVVRNAVVLQVLLVASSGCDVLTADLKHTETAEWRKTYELAPGGRVEVNNVNGKIHVEPSTGNTVEIQAVKTAKGATAEAAKQSLERIEISEDASPQRI